MSDDSEQSGEQPSDLELGPAMAALSPRQRKYVLAMCAAPLDNPTEWARMAGYRDNGKTAIRVRAWELEHDDRIRAAVFEISRQLLGTVGALLATRQLIRIASDPKEKRHSQAVEAILNRTGFHEKQEVQVTHADLTGEALIERIRSLANQLGIDPEKLLSAEINAPKLPKLITPLEYADSVIEAAAVEVSKGDPPAV
jgi:hypothetical protein